MQLNSLLVPYPQYGLNSVSMTMGEGRSQYHALVLQLRRRITSWWGGNFSYTFSQLNDNLIGQGELLFERRRHHGQLQLHSMVAHLQPGR